MLANDVHAAQDPPAPLNLDRVIEPTTHGRPCTAQHSPAPDEAAPEQDTDKSAIYLPTPEVPEPDESADGPGDTVPHPCIEVIPGGIKLLSLTPHPTIGMLTPSKKRKFENDGLKDFHTPPHPRIRNPARTDHPPPPTPPTKKKENRNPDGKNVVRIAVAKIEKKVEEMNITGKNDLPLPKKNFKIGKVLTLEKIRTIRKEKETSGKKAKSKEIILKNCEKKTHLLPVMDRGCETPIQKLIFARNVLTSDKLSKEEKNLEKTDGEKILKEKIVEKKEICQDEFRKIPPTNYLPPSNLSRHERHEDNVEVFFLGGIHQ
jgi:hypothetical protein